jgi:hypothetical protein
MGPGGWPSRQGPIAPSRKIFSRGTTVSQQKPDIVDPSLGLFRTAVANTIEAAEPLDLICQNREQQKTSTQK